MLNTEKTNRDDRAKKISKENTTKQFDKSANNQSNKQFSPKDKNQKQKTHSHTETSLEKYADIRDDDQDNEDF